MADLALGLEPVGADDQLEMDRQLVWVAQLDERATLADVANDARLPAAVGRSDNRMDECPAAAELSLFVVGSGHLGRLLICRSCRLNWAKD